jgi:hypothetical protein
MRSIHHPDPTIWLLRRYGCTTGEGGASRGPADPASVHLVRQVQLRDFDADLFLGGGSDAEFAKHEVEKTWVDEETAFRGVGCEPWFLEAPHYDRAGTLCSGNGAVWGHDGEVTHADWATEHAATWQCVLSTTPPTPRPLDPLTRAP